MYGMVVFLEQILMGLKLDIMIERGRESFA